MLKFFCVILLIATGSGLFAQPTTNRQSLKETYLRKSKNKKTTGWIMVGTGIAMIGGGIAYAESKQHDLIGLAGLAAAGAGLGLTIGGGLVLGSAEKYKRKAADIALKLEKAPHLNGRNFVFASFPALQVKIHL